MSVGLSERARLGYEQQGPLRYALYLLLVVLVIAGVGVLLFAEDRGRPLQIIGASYVAGAAALRLLRRPEPDWLWGIGLSVGAVALWAEVFGLFPYSILGA